MVYALYAGGGGRKWSRDVTPAGFRLVGQATPPVVSYGKVYTVSSAALGDEPESRLYALDAVWGLVLWWHYLGMNVEVAASPAVANGLVYVGSGVWDGS